MDESSESKKKKPKNVIESMFQKKFKSMELSLAKPNATEETSSESQEVLENQEVEKDSCDLDGDQSPPANNGELVESENDACMTIALGCLKYLLRQGLDCCLQEKRREWELDSEGNFISLYMLSAEFCDKFSNVALEKALEYHQLTTVEIQKILISACAKETTKLIVQDIGDDYFGILVDGSRDNSYELYLSIYLRYVDKRGMIKERFLGMVPVDDYTALPCKAAIDSLLMEHSLSPSKIRGQSYNGGSYMGHYLNSDIPGLKNLFMKETQCAYLFHCFSHPIHLTLALAAQSCMDCTRVCIILTDLLNLIRDSCTRKEMLEEVNAQKLLEAFGACELKIEFDEYEEFPRYKISCGEYDHYKALLHFVTMFTTICEVLDVIAEISSVEYKAQAERLLFSSESFLSFEFVFAAHLMLAILGCTDALNRALQRRDHDIANVISLVSVAKNELQRMRSDDEWEKLVKEVSSLCVKNDVEIPDMKANYDREIWSKRSVKPPCITNLVHFQVDVYFSVIDRQLQELNNLFDDTTMELLSCMACLNPTDGFSSFDKQKLIRLAEFYPGEFSDVDLTNLEYQLDIYIADVRSDDRFKNLKDLGELSTKLVETKKHDLYPTVYLLLKLVLILPVSTPSIERSISAMNYVKYKLLNNEGDPVIPDSLPPYLEREVFAQVLNDDIITRFKAMKSS